LVRIVIVVFRLRRRDGNFVDERLTSWNSRGRLGEMALRERRLKNKRGERRNE